MKTNVASTSIAIYHAKETQDMIARQFDRVAAYVVEQTRIGKPSCIGSIWEHYAKTEKTGLGQKGTVSRVCGEIREAGTLTVNGREYRFEAVSPRKFNGVVVKHFCLVQVLSAPEGVQTELFT